MMRRRLPSLLAVLALAVAGPDPAGSQSLWEDPAYVYVRESQAALEKQNYPEAARLARQALGEDPELVLAHYLVAQAALAEERWDEAVAALGEVLRRYPGSFAARREQGAALTHLDRLPEAIQAFEAALRLRPSGPGTADVKLRLAFAVLQAQDGDRALTLLGDLAREGSTVPDVWVALGRLHYERDQLQEAERALRRAAELRDDGRTWYNLAVARLRLYDRPGALEALERAARHPETREAATRELDRLRAQGPAITGPSYPVPGGAAPVVPGTRP